MGVSVKGGGGTFLMNPTTQQILLIEADPDQAAFFRCLLSTGPLAGMQVHAEGTLADGLARLRVERFALILLALTLPDSRGVETFMRVAEAAPEVAIVVFCEPGDDALGFEAVQLGAQDSYFTGKSNKELIADSLRFAIERKRIQVASLEARTGSLAQSNLRLQEENEDRRQVEQETLESNRQLVAALEQMRMTHQQMTDRAGEEAVTVMADGIGHLLEESLEPIIQISGRLLEEADSSSDTARLKSDLAVIHKRALDSAAVIRRFCEVNHSVDGKDPTSPVDANDLIQKVIFLTRPKWQEEAIGRGVTIDILTNLAEVPPIMAQEAKLQRALTALVVEAVKAIPRRGTISISTRILEGALVIKVSHDGLGMNDDQKAEARASLDGSQSSAEGGLRWIGDVIREHHGKTELETQLDRGTSVSIFLPLDADLPAPTRIQPEVPAAEALRILVVDDEPMVREVIEVYLSEDNHKITTASNGREGLAAFKAAKFDIVMTDRAMPEMDGEQMATEIKKIDPRQPVILLTGFGNFPGGQPAAIDITVGKPFTLSMLREAIKSAMELYPGDGSVMRDS